ncbi:hypothetical protein BDV97DRAFT_93082 [Delphinella strobiligena]|nr:hypothetical protein BDV97DRAFT_93082 [Delphinella strobiligena]
MAAVEHIVERERSQNLSSARFTTVNGSNLPPSRTTSFRPDQTASFTGYYSHSVARHNSTLDEVSDGRVVLEDGSSKEQGGSSRGVSQPSELPLSPLRQQGNGKRKRSIDLEAASSPDHVRPQTSSPLQLETEQAKILQSGRRLFTEAQSHGTIDSLVNERDQIWPQQQPSEMGVASDKHLAESLQSDLRAQDAQGQEQDEDSDEAPDFDVPSHNENGPHSHQDSTDGKKPAVRKRTFTQRTKTGCHTCRERKKKCDELKPVCRNCTRGNFRCKGYGPKNELDTRLGPRTPQPLQSKGVQNPQPPGYYPPPRVSIDHWVSNGNGQVALPQIDRTRPRMYEADTTYPMTGGWPRSSFSGAVDHEQYAHDQFSASTYNHAPMPDRHAPLQPRYNGPACVQPIASNSTGESSRSTGATPFAPYPPPQMSEKEKMITGRHYRHFIDEQLVTERNICRANLMNFNNACQSVVRMSPDERGRLFLEVLQPRNSLVKRPTDPIGCCGSRTIIEAPFTCEYGYNINIGDDVVIQAGCVVSDPCKITIGSRSVIGPDVKLFGMTAPMDPKLRNGSQGVVYGLPITIEEDCFIGGGAIILPGRTIRKGSVVGAGAVVSEDVQPSTVVAGDPVRTLRLNTGDDLHKPLIESQNNAILSAARTEIDIRRRANEGQFARAR